MASYYIKLGAAIAPVTGIKYVSVDGDDATADGSAGAPFASIKAASDAITDASITKEYNIYIAPGTYIIPSDMVFQPFVNFIGSLPLDCEVGGGVNHTKLTWSGFDIALSAADGYFRFKDIILESSDKLTLTNTDDGTQAFLFFSNCENRHNIEMIKNGAGGPLLELNEGFLLGSITDSGSGSGGYVQTWSQLIIGDITLTDLGVYIIQGTDMYGTITTSSVNINPTIQITGSIWQNIVANNGSIVYLSSSSNQGADTVPANGALTTVGTVTVITDAISLPKAANVTLSGGTTKTLVTEAANVKYSAAVPGNWAGSAPTTIAAAIDRLAAANPGA